MSYLTFEQIVDQLYAEIPSTEKEFLKTVERDELIRFHHSVGRAIRNDFQLWAEDNPLVDHVPMIENGIDVNPKHPDAVSMNIIEALWERVCAEE